MACIAAIGESESFITRIVDCLEDETTTEIGDKVRYGKTPAEVEKIIKEFKPDIVGISATFSMFEKDATEVANMVKKIDSSIIVILGGVTATLPEIYISLLHNNDVYDIMSRGEGEYTFIDLLRNYNKKEKKIDNLSSDIVSLQSVLTDKKTRGIFGEVNLYHIMSSVFGEKSGGF